MGAEVAALREEAEGSLTPYRAAIKSLQDRLDALEDRIELPPVRDIPQAELPDEPAVFLDGRWAWKRQTDAMRARKNFDDEDEAA